MTVEKLKETMKVAEEIKQLEKFLKAFHEPCIHGLVAHSTGNEKSVVLSVVSEHGLYKMIDSYLQNELETLKKRFEEM